jgi:hypothetical protein
VIAVFGFSAETPCPLKCLIVYSLFIISQALTYLPEDCVFPDKIHKIIAGGLFLVMLVIYLLTVAPTISFWDCGEFVTCSYIVGIPHPPGSPLLSLVGRVMSIIPFYDLRGNGIGEIAYRVNMLDVILGALTVMFTYLIMVRLLHKFRPYNGRKLDESVIMIASVITAFMAGFSDEFWTNAVEIETYMPSLFMQMLALWLTLRWDERKDNPKSVLYLFLAAYIIGLGNGVHLTVLLIAPVVFLLVLFSKPGWFSDSRFWFSSVAFIVLMGILKMYGGYAVFYGLMALFALVMPALLHKMYKQTAEVWKLSFMGVIFCFSLFIIGYSVYPTVMVRASKHPAVNEGNPDTWARYKSYMERDQYGQENMYTGMFTRKASADYQFNFMYLRYLIKQFPKWGPSIALTFTNNRNADARAGESQAVTDKAYLAIFLLAVILYGLYTHGARDWRRLLPLLIFFFVSSIGLVLYLNMQNPQVRERPYFFLGSYYIVVYWIGFGIWGIIMDCVDWLRTKGHEKHAVPVASALSVIFLTMVPTAVLSNHIDPAFTNYEVHDRMGDMAPYDYGYNILVSCEPDAILFTNGDNDTFPLWYLQEVVGFRRDVRVVNLSLLNTPWYILQMKHEGVPVPTPEEVDRLLADRSKATLFNKATFDSLGVRTTNVPKTLPIRMEDDYIENTLCGHEDSALQRRVIDMKGMAVNAAGIQWNIPAAVQLNDKVGMIRIQDEMVYNIIRWIEWTRPLYFAVTVARENMIGLDNYLSMEGMVYRIMKEKDPNGEELVNAAMLDRNIFTRYQYHELSDPFVYKPPNTLKLVTNYFVGFIQLTDRYLAMGDTSNAVRTAWGGIHNTPNDIRNRRIIYRLFGSRNYTDQLDPFLEWELAQVDTTSYDARLNYGTMLAEATLYGKSAEYFEKLSADYPNRTEVLEYLIAMAYYNKNYQQALSAADRLVAISPNTAEFKKTRDLLQNQINQQADTTAANP